MKLKGKKLTALVSDRREYKTWFDRQASSMPLKQGIPIQGSEVMHENDSSKR